MTQSAPAAIALARSPEYLMPPSPITGTSAARAASAASMMAVSCGTPTPATIRVVQIEPGPMPTLIASAPASISACAPSRVATLPAMIATLLVTRLIRATWSSTCSEWPCAVSTTMQSTPASISSRRAQAFVADRRGGGDAQAALAVLAGVGVLGRLLDVLDGDQADAAARPRRPRPASRCGAGAAAAAPRPCRRPRER